MTDLAWRAKISRLVSGGVLFDEPLSRHTSLGVGGAADALVFPGNKEELRNIVGWLAEEGISFFPLGKGTNLVVRDGGYRGIVISLRNLDTVRMERAEQDVFVRAEAGASLAGLIDLSLREGLQGIQFCAGIPGSVGGAIRMNAGAYGGEIKDVVKRVEFMTEEGVLLQLSREELSFCYRSLTMSPGALVIEAEFHLLPGNRDQLLQEVESFHSLRRQKHPLRFRNAGSIFKNPRELPAGRLIEEVGLKGARIGDAGISEQHANFIINFGQARARDVLALIEQVREKVRAEKGIILETEVCIMGEEA